MTEYDDDTFSMTSKKAGYNARTPLFRGRFEHGITYSINTRRFSLWLVAYIRRYPQLVRKRKRA